MQVPEARLLLAPFITFPDPMLLLLSEEIPVLRPDPNTLLLIQALLVPRRMP